MLLLALAAASCGSRPPRFADARPVQEIADDAPIPVPRRLDPLDEVYYSEAYVRRPIVRALDPARPPLPGDVNALDEVPRSSFWDPAAPAPADGPPEPPLLVLPTPPESGRPGIAVVDARGLGYELRRDPFDRPELRSAAAAAGSRLVRALGYRTAEIHVVNHARNDFVGPCAGEDPCKPPTGIKAPVPLRDFLRDGAPAVSGRYRFRAMRWPIGMDAGPTPPVGLRTDDPNDRVPHTERRTLRALKLALFWIGLKSFPPGAARDAYVGAAGQGHLVHYLVDFDEGFGGDALGASERASLGGEGKYIDENALTALVTLGLRRREPPALQTSWPAIGDYPPNAAPEPFETAPPFDPIDHLLPADAYWIAKRIAAVPRGVIIDAVAAAHIGDPASRDRALSVLEARRSSLFVSAARQVTPLEVDSVAPDRLILHDEAIARGFEHAEETRYTVELIDDRGAEIVPEVEIAPTGPVFNLPLPLGGADYVVARVTAVRRGDRAPRPFEAHFRHDINGYRLIGIQR